MGAVTPLGIGVESYWKGLIENRSGIGPLREFERELPSRIGGEVKNFLAADFLGKKLSKETDLFMQFALVAAEEALRAGNLRTVGKAEPCRSAPNEWRSYPEEPRDDKATVSLSGADPGRIGIVLGTALGGVKTLTETQEELDLDSSAKISPHFIPKMLNNVAAAQIAIRQGWRGPSLTVSTACSSGADAVGLATLLLRAGEADAVLAVGAESLFCSLMYAGLLAAKALSRQTERPEKASRPFDLNRDGFVMGEGAGAVLLETLPHALKRGAMVRAEILSYASLTDGYHTTAPDPTGQGEIRCMQKALAQAGLEPAAVDYINAHGTSTRIGDRVETQALKAVFGPRAYQIPVSSTKGATGHLMGAGGVTELIACVKAIEQGVVPPTLNYEVPDPLCDLDYVPNRSRPVELNIAMSNSFGFGGQNASLIVSRYRE